MNHSDTITLITLIIALVVLGVCFGFVFRERKVFMTFIVIITSSLIVLLVGMIVGGKFYLISLLALSFAFSSCLGPFLIVVGLKGGIVKEKKQEHVPKDTNDLGG